MFALTSPRHAGFVQETPAVSRNDQTWLCSSFLNLLDRIYRGLVAVFECLKGLFCGCNSWGAPDIQDELTDAISDEIARAMMSFNNSTVQGRVHGIYITTNETNLEETRQLLETHPRREKTIHIGCATWHNLDILCTRRSTYGLIIDFNPQNARFIRKTIELIKGCESREAFVGRMVEYLNSLQGAERDLFFHSDQSGLPTDRIARELSREGSWLACEESYRYLRDEVVFRDRLVAITEDMRHDISGIRELLDSEEIAIDTLYMSNICNFMRSSEDRSAFLQSMRHLVDNNTIFINCPKIRRPDGTEIILEQRAVLGEEVLRSDHLF